MRPGQRAGSRHAASSKRVCRSSTSARPARKIGTRTPAIFRVCGKSLLPTLDNGLSALVSDLHDRGLDKDVAVVVWGEMGRTPKVAKNRAGGGRDHWHDASFAVLAGGGWPMGQVIGKTDAWGSAAIGTPYTPQNVLATLYRHLGIDPATTVMDFTGRPQALLEDCTPIKELL